ncbi:hypothetical protein AQJ66_13095 [Streptomyces bungoensis]|uniref:Uncharacterized protein n=1 Tax=Streptomyces bungoensis TaxID=285568 RepID=A0A101T563_9ACTN|nr:hypothetical protein [Streptomyces bungoensis]KUN85879.1 hypothetical protein AQJ66_13095 [Streptomyces bungoensis]
MATAWNHHPDEYAAGVADSIDKAWSFVDDLYAAAGVPEVDAGEPWKLPIHGGRPVAHSAGTGRRSPAPRGHPRIAIGRRRRRRAPGWAL